MAKREEAKKGGMEAGRRERKEPGRKEGRRREEGESVECDVLWQRPLLVSALKLALGHPCPLRTCDPALLAQCSWTDVPTPGPLQSPVWLICARTPCETGMRGRSLRASTALPTVLTGLVLKEGLPGDRTQG